MISNWIELNQRAEEARLRWWLKTYKKSINLNLKLAVDSSHPVLERNWLLTKCWFANKEVAYEDKALVSATSENVCDLRGDLSYCICDDITEQAAHEIRCHITTVASQTDDLWTRFRTQTHLFGWHFLPFPFISRCCFIFSVCHSVGFQTSSNSRCSFVCWWRGLIGLFGLLHATSFVYFNVQFHLGFIRF